MTITIYRRHGAECPEKSNRYAPRCGCPLWFQFLWLNYQNKWSAETQNWSEAQSKAKALEKNLEALAEGKTVSNRECQTVER
jgi:hypothetical protein